jgi:outer membrane protein assembly factor BamB
VPHDGNVIVLVGGPQAVVAFRPEDGSVAWRSGPGSVSYASPLVIDVDGQQQLVYFSADEVIGLDASDGTRLWSHTCVNEYSNNATNAIWGEDNLLWVATQLDGGARALRLDRADGATRVEEVWFSNKVSIHFWNSIRLGDTVYASIGSQASILAGIDVRSGEIRWRTRGFKQANLVQAGDKTVLLDEEGTLALVRLSPDGLEVLARTRLSEGQTWTVPSLVGTTLYFRDKETILALDLAAGPESGGLP